MLWSALTDFSSILFNPLQFTFPSKHIFFSWKGTSNYPSSSFQKLVLAYGIPHIGSIRAPNYTSQPLETLSIHTLITGLDGCMLGTRYSAQLHPAWFKAVLLSSMLLESILLVCGSSAMSCKCYFPPFHLDQHQHLYLFFIYSFTRTLTGKCYRNSFGAFESAF